MLNIKSIIACPSCKSGLQIKENYYMCSHCSKNKLITYKIINQVPIFLAGKETDNFQKFWNDGWKKRETSEEFIHMQMSDKHYKFITKQNVNKTYLNQNPLAFINVKKNATILNIGCGLSESSGFSEMGYENYIGVDLSFIAAYKSLKNIRKYNNTGITMQANAESLPIKSEAVDFVYSSGVLHHTPHIEKTILEIERVLKENGTATLGIYNSHSPKFLMTKLKHLLSRLFKLDNRNWYEATETAWQTKNNYNPWSKTFSKNEIYDLFEKSKLEITSINKTNFNWGDSLPVIGKYLSKIKLFSTSLKFMRKYFGSMWVINLKKIGCGGRI